MELQRKIRALANKMSPSPGKSTHHHSAASSQGLATLIVMIAVLTIIVLFCCFAAPGVRDLCKRYIFRNCAIDDPDRDNASTAADSATPTIILLPYGRMLVVDRAVFAQLQADNTGIDFMELSANLIRAQRLQTGSTPSILDSEATSKGLSPTSLGFSPPAYEDIFGDKNSDLPPSYSELSLMFRAQSRNSRAMIAHAPAQNIELCDFYNEVDVNNENNLNKEIDEENVRAGADNNSGVAIELEECDATSPEENEPNVDCIIRESSI